MRTAGIIAEYNPFHNGHAWQIAELKNAALRAVVCVCSPGVVQRGTAALFPARCVPGLRWPPGRTWCSACRHPYATLSAEGFAAAGVALLSALGVWMLCASGTETRRLEDIAQTAALLESPDFPEAARAAGRGLAPRRAAAAEALCPGAGAVLRAPNDILGVEYVEGPAAPAQRTCALALPRRARGPRCPAGCGAGAVRFGFALRALVRAGERRLGRMCRQPACGCICRPRPRATF